MTNDTPRARIDAAQAQLERVTADTTRLTELLTLLEESRARAEELATYYHGTWVEDRDVVLADLGEQVGPSVLGEDPAWEALADREDLLQRLLRATTAELTRHLDATD